MNESHYDAIVIGVGGMGSATVFELARRGARVLGLEQFDLVHDQGSSHGQTRIIRTAYYEDPCYVPLVQRSFAGWYDLEQRLGRKLLTECGCLTIGQAGSEVLQGVLRSAREHSLVVDELTSADLLRRFPQFRFADDYRAALERQAGFLYVEDCVQAHIDAARILGAEIHAREAMKEWNATRSGVTVVTEHGRYSANRLIFTAGPWATRLLAGVGIPLTVMRQTLLWFGLANPARFRRDVFPIFLAETPEGCYYGLPAIDNAGLKVARHYGAPEQAGPDEIDRTVLDSDEMPVREFLRAHIPEAAGPRTRGQACTYTLTPDRHFILDRYPQHEEVVIAAGFSGHGFKFAPVVGEIMADLATEGRTDHSIERFRVARFQTGNQ